MDNDAYFGRLERREQGKVFFVVMFSRRIRFCEARSNRKSDTAHPPQVSVLTFYTWETKKMKSCTNWQIDWERTGVYVLQPSASVLLPLRTNDGGRETYTNKTKI